MQSLIRDLPDERAAVAFLDRLQQEQPRAYQNLLRERGLLSDTLALVSWSPLLGTTLEQNPNYISWLQRERLNARVRSCEELKESLARFALTNSSLPPAVMLARFRRRELLRTYLHDVRGTHALVETTEELSNVADAVLDYALNLARQDLDNKYGLPRLTDDRGRIATAEFTIVALGKLGSYELNYASDIDLMFIYSDEGTTSGVGERGEVTNREYFVKLAESVAKLVGQPAGEGAAYRVDLRLRPHGRDGALACSLIEAVRYYREKAQSWELQALIRARSAAGSGPLFQRFSNAVRESVFRADISVAAALASVRLAKQKIDRRRERETGFNVKLQRGGIREIEFIAQALQLAHAGRDEWLRASHTLISLGRLADRNLISEHERTCLSDAYVFLRTLEHRLQMDQGLQTHTVPQRTEARALVARRMNFSGDLSLEHFDKTLAMHAGNVRRAYDRVFQESESVDYSQSRERQGFATSAEFDPHSVAARTTASLLLPHVLPLEPADHLWNVETLTQRLKEDAARSVNPHRALILLARVAASVDKASQHIQIAEDTLSRLVLLCGASEFFGEILASNPVLINSMGHSGATSPRRDLKGILKANLDSQNSFSAELSALRQQWSRVLVEIGLRDATAEISVTESNRLQTELAVASLNVSSLSARREMIRRYDRLVSAPRIAILGLGRLSTGGVDYGSDLDLIIVYDSLVPSPVASLTREEAYARLAELMTSALSSVTREGFLYRVDLRLRPNGQSGPLVVSSEALLDYAKENSAIWEWLAYVKLRAVAGDLELGKMIETHARHAIHELARKTSPADLKRETRRVRDRLEMEKGKRARQGELDIKYAAGGMLDVYFATRYLQLVDDVPDEGEDRSTRFTLERLEANGSLTSDDYSALAEGYTLLRSVDHQLRLVLGRSIRLPSADHPVARDVAKKVGFNSSSELFDSLNERMKAIRVAYDNLTTD